MERFISRLCFLAEGRPLRLHAFLGRFEGFLALLFLFDSPGFKPVEQPDIVDQILSQVFIATLIRQYARQFTDSFLGMQTVLHQGQKFLSSVGELSASAHQVLKINFCFLIELVFLNFVLSQTRLPNERPRNEILAGFLPR